MEISVCKMMFIFYDYLVFFFPSGGNADLPGVPTRHSLMVRLFSTAILVLSVDVVFLTPKGGSIVGEKDEEGGREVHPEVSHDNTRSTKGRGKDVAVNMNADITLSL